MGRLAGLVSGDGGEKKAGCAVRVAVCLTVKREEYTTSV